MVNVQLTRNRNLEAQKPGATAGSFEIGQEFASAGVRRGAHLDLRELPSHGKGRAAVTFLESRTRLGAARRVTGAPGRLRGSGQHPDTRSQQAAVEVVPHHTTLC